MSEISKVHDWLLGDYMIDPPLQVPDSPYGSWEPDKSGRYSAHAAQYAVMYPQNVANFVHDIEEGSARAEQLAAAHNGSVLFPAFRVMLMVGEELVYPDGEAYEYDGDSKNGGLPRPGEILPGTLRLDTELLRFRHTEKLRNLGHAVTWEGEPPFVGWPLPEEILDPGMGGFVPSPNAPRISEE